MITVSLAINDPDNGLFCRRISRIEIHGHQGCDISLECRVLEGNAFSHVDGVLARHRGAREDRTFRISGTAFPCYGWKSWYGNWCWDATRMSAVEVLKLLRFLRDKGWFVDQAGCEFADAWDAKQPITPELLDRDLNPDAEVTA